MPRCCLLYLSKNDYSIDVPMGLMFSGTKCVMCSWTKPFSIQPRLLVALINKASPPFSDFFVSPVIWWDCKLIFLDFVETASFESKLYIDNYKKI